MASCLAEVGEEELRDNRSLSQNGAETSSTSSEDRPSPHKVQYRQAEAFLSSLAATGMQADQIRENRKPAALRDGSASGLQAVNALGKELIGSLHLQTVQVRQIAC